MSGETEEHVSGWTVDTLKEYLSRRLDDLGLRMDRRMDDADKAIQAALISAEKAVTKAEEATQRRFEGVNEFRAALADQTATFIPRAEFDAAVEAASARITANAERVAALELRIQSRLDLGEGAASGESASRTERRLDTGQILTAVSVVVGALVLALALYAAFHK